ncbi:porin [Microvirga flavescens]|uniref:porin n=1 Tax=Microvirga flavescens TaxID=2249811 RepID=UPI000DD62341|nr:porin [Microvirga flavescens]
MTFAKRLLVGSALGLAAAAGAQAADLPAKSALPVEYVRVCSAYGSGFFYVPGTDSCLKIGGRVRAEMLYVDPLTRADDTLGFRVRGRIQLDNRTATAYGLLRAFVRFEITRVSGLPFGQLGTISTTPAVAQAYVQFAGLTAGQVTSFFSNPDLPVVHMGTIRYDDAPDVALLAYTYSFGNGLSASLSVEDGLGRRQLNSFTPIATTAALTPAGQMLPDVVANLRYAGTWGSVQLAGALHQIRDDGVANSTVNGVFVPGRPFAGTEYGYAVGVQGSVNLPMIAPSDSAWYALTYVDGALSYLGFGTYNASRFGAGLVSTPAVDVFVNPLTNEISKAKGYSIAGGFNHYWTPTFRSSVFGSYARVEYSNGATAIGPLGNVTGLPDFSEWRLGASTFWMPVSGFAAGAEVIYINANPQGRILTTQAGAAGSLTRLIGADSAIEGRLRLQRDF